MERIEKFQEAINKVFDIYKENFKQRSNFNFDIKTENTSIQISLYLLNKEEKDLFKEKIANEGLEVRMLDGDLIIYI
jgi:dTDP-4-amino-4,6-dideoxygalactose transaminase